MLATVRSRNRTGCLLRSPAATVGFGQMEAFAGNVAATGACHPQGFELADVGCTVSSAALPRSGKMFRFPGLCAPPRSGRRLRCQSMSDCAAPKCCQALRPEFRSRDFRESKLQSFPGVIHHEHVHAARKIRSGRFRFFRIAVIWLCQSVRRNPDDIVFTVEHSIRAVHMPSRQIK